MTAPAFTALRKAARTLGAVALLTVTAPAFAQLIAYEGFDYAVGSVLEGQNGGSGWGDVWDASAVGTDAFATATSPGLLYSSVNAAYAALDANAVGLGAVMNAGVGGNATQDPVRLLSGARGADGTAATSTTWISIIAQRTVGATGNLATGAGANFQLRSSSAEIIAIGKHSGFTSDYWSIYTAGAAANTATVAAGSQVSTSVLSLLLLRITHVQNGNDLADLWVNPDVSLGEIGLGAATASIVATSELSFDRVRLFASTGAAGATGSAATDGAILGVDEIRVAGDFASAIPEPSTYAALLGALTLGVALLARRRDRR